MYIHVNELKFEGNNSWVKQFNKCSELYQQNKIDEWFEEKLKLELGLY